MFEESLMPCVLLYRIMYIIIIIIIIGHSPPARRLRETNSRLERDSCFNDAMS